jgi:hypothetical protein
MNWRFVERGLQIDFQLASDDGRFHSVIEHRVAQSTITE